MARLPSKKHERVKTIKAGRGLIHSFADEIENPVSRLRFTFFSHD